MKKILVVDDEQKIRNVYAKVLTEKGFEVIEADSADTAYNLMQHNPVDLVLLDINLGRTDGAVFYEIEQTFYKNTKVIVSSVYPLEYQKTYIKGAAGYYDKSDSISVLINKREALTFLLINKDNAVETVNDIQRLWNRTKKY